MHCPDLYQMLVGTTRREIGKDEMNNILHHLVGLLQEQLKIGYLSDEVLERAGIHQDFDNNGKVVRRSFPITSELRQRSKTLNHAVQIMERQRVVDTKEAIMKQKCKVECCSRKKILENNALLMSKIFEADKSIHPHKNITTLVDVSLQGFGHKSDQCHNVKGFHSLLKIQDIQSDRWLGAKENCCGGCQKVLTALYYKPTECAQRK